MRAMRVDELAKFMIARDAVRQNKEAGKPKPWTKDEILQTYRFCNVHREDDAVTRWLRKHWYSRFGKNKDVGFAAVIARLLNLPESLEAVGSFVLPWKPDVFASVLHVRKDNKQKNFNAAYIVSTNGVAMDKVDYLAKRVLEPLWDTRKDLRPRRSLAEWHAVLMEHDGLGSFLAAQVIADLKYLPPLFDRDIGIPTSYADDWYTFAASGPGSRRGLNRVSAYAVDSTVEAKHGVARCLADPCAGRSRASCRSSLVTASTRRTYRIACASLTSTSASG
jgi:hypothetical protein